MAKLFNYHRYENLLDESTLSSLFDFCISNKDEFYDAEIGNKLHHTLNKDYRICLINKNLCEFEKVFEEKITLLMSDIQEKLQIKPFEVDSYQMQIAAHGDGAFFKQHIDTHTNHENQNKTRIISAVFYFFKEPKEFDGGELVLHPFDFLPGNDQSIHLAPINNSLVVFPSFGLHEVLPVSCPEVSFDGWRFAINCWVNKV